MARPVKPQIEYKADDVWAAACAAQRINDSYVKYVDPEINPGVTETNRMIMDRFLANPDSIEQVDRDMAEKVRTYYKAFTFKILRGIKLNEFDNNAMLIANRDTIVSSYDVAVACSLPSCYTRSVARDEVNRRIEFATGGYVGNLGAKVQLKSLEVIKCNFSQQYGVYFVTGITPEDQVVFFSYKNAIDPGKVIDVAGTVKAHRENSTQLNRVKVI